MSGGSLLWSNLSSTKLGAWLWRWCGWCGGLSVCLRATALAVIGGGERVEKPSLCVWTRAWWDQQPAHLVTFTDLIYFALDFTPSTWIYFSLNCLKKKKTTTTDTRCCVRRVALRMLPCMFACKQLVYPATRTAAAAFSHLRPSSQSPRLLCNN